MAPPQANTVSQVWQVWHMGRLAHGERLEARTAGAHAAVHAQAHVQALLRRLAARRQLLPKPCRPLIRAQRRRPPPASLGDFLRSLRGSARGRRTWQSARRQLLAFNQVTHSSARCLSHRNSAPLHGRGMQGGSCSMAPALACELAMQARAGSATRSSCPRQQLQCIGRRGGGAGGGPHLRSSLVRGGTSATPPSP